MNNSSSYEQELQQRGVLIYTTKGRSMRPFLRSGADLFQVVRKTGDRCRKYDAVLYRRDNGQYVLHRVVKVCHDSYTLCGDNTWQMESGIREDQILGILTAVIRSGRKIDVSRPGYCIAVGLWWAIYPLRAVFLRLRGKWWTICEKRKNK